MSALCTALKIFLKFAFTHWPHIECASALHLAGIHPVKNKRWLLDWVPITIIFINYHFNYFPFTSTTCINLFLIWNTHTITFKKEKEDISSEWNNRSYLNTEMQWSFTECMIFYALCFEPKEFKCVSKRQHTCYCVHFGIWFIFVQFENQDICWHQKNEFLEKVTFFFTENLYVFFHFLVFQHKYSKNTLC